MSDNPEKLIELGELILLKLEDRISDEQMSKLNDMLARNPEAVNNYVDFITVCGVLKRHSHSYERSVGNYPASVVSEDIWEALAEEERTACGITVERPVKSADEPAEIPVSVHRGQVRVDRTVSKVSLITTITSMAALVFIMVYVWLNPHSLPPLVAKLTDTMDARWNNQGPQIKLGDDLRAGLLELQQGYAEITFDCGAEALIEAPAKVELERTDQMKVHYGRLYAIVPPQALGFTISSPNAKIIDLGTEFGIEVGLWGETELHVIKGRTILISSTDTGVKTKREVTQGQAKKVSAAGGIQDVPLKKVAFARQIDSAANFIWKGQTALNLADIVGGGNGLDSGRSNIGIDPLTGMYQKRIEGYEREGDTECVVVADNSLIDSVFIPDENEQGFVVSSTGHRYRGFCDTNNKAWIEICNGLANASVDSERDRSFQQGIRLAGEIYSNNDKSVLVMHSNSGITFDLDNIRRMCPQLEIVKFKALCGIPDQIEESDEDFWAVLDIHVLLDGQRCFLKEKFNTTDRKKLISIPIQPDKHFLTLAVTDSGNGNHGDYVIFAEPELTVETDRPISKGYNERRKALKR